jgi:predicted nucleic acid-binding protein
MNGSFLLDTDAAISLFSGNAALLKLFADADLFIPIVVIGELYYGAYKSDRVTENLAPRADRFDQFEPGGRPANRMGSDRVH